MAGKNSEVNSIEKKAQLIKSLKERATQDKFGRKIIFDSRIRRITIDGYYYSVIYDDQKGYRFILYRGNAIRFSPIKLTIRSEKDIDELITLLQKLKGNTTVKAISYLNEQEGYLEEEEEEIIL